MSDRKKSRAKPKRPVAKQKRRVAPRRRLAKPRNALVTRTAPVAVASSLKTSTPNFISLPNGDCRIKHREFIVNLTSAAIPTDNKTALLPINPGLPAIFPWLSSIARNYESYKFNMLKFHYLSASPTAIGGTIIMAVDYDARDDPPTTKQQFMAYRSSVRTAPWASVTHNSLTSDLSKLKQFFVRVDAQPAGTDIKTYDVGNLNIWIEVSNATELFVGELHVEYDVTFYTPQASIPTAIVASHQGGEFIPSAPYNTNPFSGSTYSPGYNSFEIDEKTSSLILKTLDKFIFNFGGQHSFGAGIVSGSNITTPTVGAGTYTHEYFSDNGTQFADVWSIIPTVVPYVLPYVLLHSTGAISLSNCKGFLSCIP